MTTDRHAAHDERLVELPGISSGRASEQLVGLAQRHGYTVVAAGPGSFRLARTRRTMALRKKVESATATVFEDRSGTKARLVGAVDPLLVEQLAAGASPPAPPGHQAPVSASPPVSDTAAGHAQHSIAAPAPAAQLHGPANQAVEPPRPTPPGLISSPWTAPAGAPPSMPPPGAPRLGHVHADDVDGHTIARPAIRRAGAVAQLPDGRTVDLSQPVVVGRNPDPARGPAGSVAVVHPDPSLSKTHAVLELSGASVFVTDLNSTNGTVVESNGTTAACAPAVRCAVPDRAVIRLGEVPISIRVTT